MPHVFPCEGESVRKSSIVYFSTNPTNLASLIAPFPLFLHVQLVTSIVLPLKLGVPPALRLVFPILYVDCFFAFEKYLI
jgi:hypothetical protein